MRLSFVGELGWELHIPRSSCVPVYQAVMTAGAKHGLVNAGYRAIDSLSIEKGACGAQTVLVGCPEASWRQRLLPPTPVGASASLLPRYTSCFPSHCFPDSPGCPLTRSATKAGEWCQDL